MSESVAITEKQMVQLRRLAVGVFVMYKSGIESTNFGVILAEAAEGFSTRHALPLDVTEACLGHLMNELTQRDWALVVLRRRDQYITGAIMNKETVADDEAVIRFVRQGLSQIPVDVRAGGGNGETHFGDKQ
jgi:hypothetical protein